MNFINDYTTFTSIVLVSNLLLAVIWKKSDIVNLVIKLLFWFISGWSFYLLIK